MAAAYPFVGTIRTVEFAIAPPLGSYAILLRTLELLNGITLCGITFGLVGTVAAIVIAIAHPTILDTSAVAASKLIRATSVI